jgi:O-antigen/teichoic acid export membrane protein
VRQQLVRNLLFVLIVNVLVKAVWFFMIDRNVQIRVGYASYGTYQALFNLGLIFQILLDFGLTQYNSREVATDPKRIRVLFSSMLWTRIVLSFFYLAIVLLIGLLLGYRPPQILLLAGVLLIPVFNSMLVFLRSNVAALHYFRTDGVLAVIDRLLMIGVCGVLLSIPRWSAQFKIEWFVWSQILCYAAAVLIAFVVLLKLTPVPVHFSVRPKMIRKVIRESAPYALLVFLMSVYMRSDAVLIERLCGAEGKVQAGVYASAFRLLDVANIFGLMFAGILLPMFARMIAAKEAIAPAIRIAVNIMMPIAFIVAVASLFYGNEVMNMLYHKAWNYESAQVFTLLMWSFPPYCLMYIYSTLLTANGNIRLLNKISFCIVVLNLTLHCFLIPAHQAEGAAQAVLITEWAVAATVIIYAHRVFSLPHNFKWLAVHLGYVGSLFLLGYAVTAIPVSWLYQLFVFLAGSFLLLFLFRFWTIPSLFQLLQQKKV